MRSLATLLPVLLLACSSSTSPSIPGGNDGGGSSGGSSGGGSGSGSGSSSGGGVDGGAPGGACAGSAACPDGTACTLAAFKSANGCQAWLYSGCGTYDLAKTSAKVDTLDDYWFDHASGALVAHVHGTIVRPACDGPSTFTAPTGTACTSLACP